MGKTEASKHVVEIVIIRQAARDIADANMADIVTILSKMEQQTITDLALVITTFAQQVHTETEKRLEK